MAWIELAWPPGEPPKKMGVGDGLRFGRSPDCDVVLDDESISAKHAWLHPDGERFVLVDLHSANGIRIKGLKTEEGVLAHGDEFALADIAGWFFNPPEPVEDPARDEPAEACPVCGYLFAGPATRCPRCRHRRGKPALTVERQEYDPLMARKQARIWASLALAGGVTGPLFLGVGWLVGVAGGLYVLLSEHLEPGPKDIRMAHWGIGLGLVWIVVLIRLLWR